MYYSNLEHFKGLSGYDIDGIWYPRVTKIVDIKAKPALYKFYAEMNNFAESEAVKKQSASEGTLVHETIEAILTGKKEPIEEAKEMLAKITQQNKIMADNLKKAEKLQAEIMLSGKTPAGAPMGKTKEEAEIEEAKKLIAGTGFEDRIFPPKK